MGNSWLKTYSDQNHVKGKDQARDKVQVRGRVRVEVKINHWTYLQGKQEWRW